MKLEDLANEVFYEIFEYLDHFESYEIFSNLNQRFQNLFINPTRPIKIHLESISKSNFQSYYQNIIVPYQHRIQSLHLSNPFLIDFFLSSISLIPKLIHLQTFIIEDIRSNYLEQLLNTLSVLPNLSSLVVICKCYVPKRNHFYEQIFRLSALKYCKFSMQEYHHTEYLPVKINQLSPITHLVIEDTFNINELSTLLSYVPQLHRLSIRKLSTSMYTPVNICSRIPNQLIHVSLNLGDVYFNDFEPMIKYVFHQVQVLHLSTPADQTYLMANRWESLIPFYMPHLRIFNLYQHVHTNKADGEVYMHLIDQFESSFWFERQWFFAYHMKQLGDYCEIYFYSTDPYRRRQFTIESELRKKTTPFMKQTQMNSVHHLELKDEACLVNWTSYFPNVTQLTLERANPFEEQKYIPPMILNRLLPLEQITELNIYVSHCYFNSLIQIIISMPNIQRLCLSRPGFDPTDVNLLKSDETVHLMSVTNKIKYVTIAIQQCSFEDMKLLVNLFPQMKHLTISMAKGCLVEIVQYLLSENNHQTPYLHSLWIRGFQWSSSEKIQSLIQSQNRFIDHMTDNMLSIRLWW